MFCEVKKEAELVRQQVQVELQKEQVKDHVEELQAQQEVQQEVAHSWVDTFEKTVTEELEQVGSDIERALGHLL